MCTFDVLIPTKPYCCRPAARKTYDDLKALHHHGECPACCYLRAAPLLLAAALLHSKLPTARMLPAQLWLHATAPPHAAVLCPVTPSAAMLHAAVPRAVQLPAHLQTVLRR